MKASQQAIERGVKDCLFIDYKRRSGHFDVTTVACIKEITDKVLFCAFLSLQILSDKMKRLSAFGQDKLSQLWLFNLWQWTIKGKIADGENGRRWLLLFLCRFDAGLSLFARHRPARHWEAPQCSHLSNCCLCPLQKRQADQVSINLFYNKFGQHDCGDVPVFLCVCLCGWWMDGWMDR